MGFFNMGGQKIPDAVKTEIVVGLTPLGKEKVTKLSGSEREFMCLLALSEHGPSSVDEVSEYTKLGKSKTRYQLNQLMNNGFVMRMGARGTD
jgi:DNA-binding MarR family transcriptional regulator